MKGKEPKEADWELHTYGLDGMLGLLSVNEVDEALLLGIGQVIPQHLNQGKTKNTLSVISSRQFSLLIDRLPGN